MNADVIRIVIADDNRVIRMSLRWLLETDPRFQVVGEAENGYVAVALVEQLQPDIVLMDLNMPYLNGIEATRIITSSFPETHVVVLTMHNDSEYLRQSLDAGAGHFLPKGCSREEIVSAISCEAAKNATRSMPVPA